MIFCTALHRGGLALALLTALLGAQCQKDDPVITLQGRITEYGTGKPIEGARVYLLCYGGGFWGSSESKQTDVIVTDADGRFFQQFPADNVCGGAYLIVWKEGYFKRDGLGFSTGNNQLDIVLDPEAWLEVVTVPDITGNRIYFAGSFTGAAGWETWLGHGTRKWVFLTKGNVNSTIRWGPFSDPSINFFDTLYLPAHDTTMYTIHY